MRNELICKFERTICDDVFNAVRRALLQQEVNSAGAIGAAEVDEIGSQNAVARLSQHLDNCARPATRLPNGIRQPFDLKQRKHGFAGCFVDIVAALREPMATGICGVIETVAGGLADCGRLKESPPPRVWTSRKASAKSDNPTPGNWRLQSKIKP